MSSLHLKKFKRPSFWFKLKLRMKCWRFGHTMLGTNEGTMCVKCGIQGDITEAKHFIVVERIGNIYEGGESSD